MVDFEVQEIDEDYDGEQFPPVGNVAEEIPPLALPGATMSASRYPAALVEKCRALGSDVFTSVENIAKEHNVGRHVVYKLSKLVYSNQTNNPYNDFLSWFSRMRNMDPKYEPFGGREFNGLFLQDRLVDLEQGLSLCRLRICIGRPMVQSRWLEQLKLQNLSRGSAQI